MRAFNVTFLGSPDLTLGELFSGVFSVSTDVFDLVREQTIMLDESIWWAIAVDRAYVAYIEQCQAQGIEPVKVTSIVMSEVI
jgi:predicted HicB family RNase H-like nuclease